MDLCPTCGALVDWDAEADRRCRGCGEEIEMSDAVLAVMKDLAETFPDVAPERIRQVCDEMIAQWYARADRDTESVLDALTACEADGCRTITAIYVVRDGRRICSACRKAERQAARDAAGITATHGPELPRW